MSRTATHRPAKRRRRSRHDDPVAVELFSGFGGLTQGIKLAGFETIMAANHNEFKVEVHEANHPEAEHWIADLVDPESGDYHDARDLPAGDLLSAGVSCVNHSIANTVKAYEQGLTLFSMVDPEFEERVTRSERDRATANCVLHYAAVHHPRLILVECTTELTSWGPAIPGKAKVGDGSTYRWWLKQFDTLGYDHKVIYLNSMFFGVPQSRDRYYAAFWDKTLPAPDLEHRPESWCARCDTTVESVWSWKTGVPPTGSVRYGKQYNYRCPRCRTEVFPPMTPSIEALDLTNLGTRIGDKPHKKQRDGSIGPLAKATMARAERCRQRFGDFPAVLMPAKAVHGTEKHPWQPMATQTSQQETAILSTGALLVAAGNTFERPGSDCRSRDLGQPLWAQTATNGTGVLTPPVAVATGSVIAAHRHNGDGQHITRPMDTMTSTHEKAMLLAVANYQGAPRSAGEPLPTQAGSETLGMVSAGIVPFRQNTIPTTHAESMPTVTSDQIPGLLTAAGATQLAAEWRARLGELTLDDCYFRMLGKHEIGRGCGFDVDFPGYQGTFVVWGTARAQTDGFGNAVSPAVGAWIGARLRAVLDTPEAIA
ncbi:DNA cytosine methyltransferase [Amycolatopsis japonica]|uniref:DNA cytosine methyltransferase n=1 Tax=Amycolatopsis japonica TaxID=208439 RepID=UPI0033C416CA